MITYRNIVKVKNGEVSFKLPDNFTSKEVEVIVISYSNTDNQPDIEQFFGVSNIDDNLVEEFLTQIRDEWE